MRLGQEWVFSAFIRDVTDTKRAAGRLRESEFNLRQLTETIPEMLWSATQAGAIDYCNARVLDYTGFSAEEIMGDGWKKLFHPDDLNALPQFVTEIDGLEIQFAHVRSRHADALPLIITRGWPGSIIELLKVVGPLTDPTAHGGRPEDAFQLFLPSLPGYGFSGKPESTGWAPDRIARAWAELMGRLEYTSYVSQGGDWSSVVSDVMAAPGAGGNGLYYAWFGEYLVARGDRVAMLYHY